MRRARAFGWLLSWAALSQPISHQVYPHVAFQFTPSCWSLACGVTKDNMFPVTMEELWVLETRNETVEPLCQWHLNSVWACREWKLLGDLHRRGQGLGAVAGVPFVWRNLSGKELWCRAVTQHWQQLEGADKTRLTRVKKLCWESEIVAGDMRQLRY